MKQVIVEDKVLNLEIVPSKIAKQIRFQLTPDFNLKMIHPEAQVLDEDKIDYYIARANNWLKRTINKMQDFNFIYEKKYSAEEIGNFKNRMYGLVRKYEELTGLKSKKIFFRKQKTKLGTCSSESNISFNLKLINYPQYVQEYIVAHEIAHLKYKNHHREFKRYVSQIYSETNKALNWLKENKMRN